MYCVSRHFRQISVEVGLAGKLRAAAQVSRIPLIGRKQLSSFGGSSSRKLINGTNRTVFQKPWTETSSNKIENLKQFSQYRCYSKSAKKVAVEGENGVESSQTVQDDDGSKPLSTEVSVDELDELAEDEEDGLFLTDEELNSLTDGDPELIKRVKYIQLEYSVMKQDGEEVPSSLKFKHWMELLPLNSRSKRKKFYMYLFKTEMKETSQSRKKEEKRLERLRMYAENPLPSKEEDVYGTCYALSRNAIFLRLYDATITRFHHCRVANAMLHHPPLIIDCSYDEFMTHREAKNCAKQLEYLITENRTHVEPFNIHICNAGKETKTMQFLYRMIPVLDDDNFAINMHEESYMDIFPRDRLVYLTPHCRDELIEYNEDDIYIIGAMVDKTDSRPHSLAKAKKLNLRMKRLPLDQHLMWGLGGKSLTLNQMVKIMLDVRYSRGDWKTALKHVPMRKLCRDFHPYPDQVENQGQQQSSFNPEEMLQLSRRERRSPVMEDYELLNRRKGFRRSDSFGYKPQRSPQAVQAPRIKSLLQNDE